MRETEIGMDVKPDIQKQWWNSELDNSFQFSKGLQICDTKYPLTKENCEIQHSGVVPTLQMES